MSQVRARGAATRSHYQGAQAQRQGRDLSQRPSWAKCGDLWAKEGAGRPLKSRKSYLR